MFRWLTKNLKYLSLLMHNTTDGQEQSGSFTSGANIGGPHLPTHVSSDLNRNLEALQACFGMNEGVLYRTFLAGKTVKRPALLVAVSGMVEKTMINESVLSPIMNAELPAGKADIMGHLRVSVLAVMDIKEEKDFMQVVQQVLGGNAALFMEGESKVLLIQLADWNMRGVEQSTTETVIRGPKDSFNEDLATNLMLLRRRIHHPKLRFESLTLGSISRTKVVISYLDGIVDDAIVEEVRNRVKKIKMPAVLESGYIEQYIEDAPFSLFPTVSNSEKPDIVASRLLEGRVAIFVDGTPFVLVVPDQLINHFHVSEDYYSRPYLTNLVRLLRVVSFLLTIMLPGLFVSIIYHHPILIPFSLLVKLAKLREDVPFQLYIEITTMILVFEIIKESGIRMPRPIGQAVSLVGALILGQAAVDAGLVSIPVVVIVAFSGVSSFLVTSLNDTISLLRILFVLAGTAFGLYGVLVLGMFVVTHLASLRSFGMPYATPLFPINWQNAKDAVLRFPLRMLWNKENAMSQGTKEVQYNRGGKQDGQRK
jgi:spore germination protein KA